ncbi:hypothetical protein TRVA0_001S01750 [Trichomonascus vanleenenianus]
MCACYNSTVHAALQILWKEGLLLGSRLAYHCTRASFILEAFD